MQIEEKPLAVPVSRIIIGFVKFELIFSLFRYFERREYSSLQ
tara:strand:+ start:322 stop:447 length:126 start_codon:yes stop_codon:yes gene_type:complete